MTTRDAGTTIVTVTIAIHWVSISLTKWYPPRIKNISVADRSIKMSSTRVLKKINGAGTTPRPMYNRATMNQSLPGKYLIVCDANQILAATEKEACPPHCFKIINQFIVLMKKKMANKKKAIPKIRRCEVCKISGFIWEISR